MVVSRSLPSSRLKLRQKWVRLDGAASCCVGTEYEEAQRCVEAAAAGLQMAAGQLAEGQRDAYRG